MGVSNGVTVEVEGLGRSEGPVTVAFSIRRRGGAYAARADLDAAGPLLCPGAPPGRTVGEATEEEVVAMAARELIGTVQPAGHHREHLALALAEAREGGDPARVSALAWALELADGHTPAPAVA